MTRDAATASGAAELDGLSWPFEQASAALEALVRASRLEPGSHSVRVDTEAPVAPPELLHTIDGQGRWLTALAGRLGVELVAVEENYPEVARLVRSAPPALFALAQAGANGRARAPRLLAVLSAARGQLCVLAPAGERARVRADALTALLLGPLAAHARPKLDELLEAAGISGARRLRAEQTLLVALLADAAIQGCWLLRPPDHGRPPACSSRVLVRATAVLLLASLGQYAVWTFAWQRVAEGALYGALDAGQLAGWLVALLTTVPLQALISWRSARHSLAAGAWLRQRLLGGLLARGPGVVRGAGIGQLLGRIIDAGAVESLGLGGVLVGGLALLDLAVAALLLGNGVSRAPLLGLFASVLVLVLLVARSSFRRRAAWTESRMLLTDELVECMQGQRTRVVQESPDTWHVREDSRLESHLERARHMDYWSALFSGLPRLWLLTGCAYLSLAVLPRAPAESLPLALALGGVLLGYRALGSLSAALAQLSGALIAWQNVAPLLDGTEPRPGLATEPLLHRATKATPSSMLRAHQLTLRATDRSSPVLVGADLRIVSGDRLLLQGPSGSGKSTLARALAGLAPVDQGLLLLDGLDLATLGLPNWRRAVTLTPQFHDNHVFGSTLAFNLLLGRSWPPQPSDLADAARVCDELGLGPLLARMPLGLMQVVGETGWQLSHGERSRVFAARALLGRAELVVLDESLGALDPTTALCVLDCAEKRARSLLLIAHLAAGRER